MEEEKKPKRNWFIEVYDKQYKKLMIIPFLMLFFALVVIGLKFAETGDFINKDVSLKGGLTITILTETPVDIIGLQNSLAAEFKGHDISVRSLNIAGEQTGIVLDSDVGEESIDGLIKSIESKIGVTLEESNYSIEIMGSSLGASFFKETIKAVYVAFLFMGVVVFLYFGVRLYQKIMALILTIAASLLVLASKDLATDIAGYIIGAFLIGLYIKYSAPSIAVILAAVSDIIVTLAVVYLMGMKISTAGIATFLMLIGYSVDTDILLTTRVLKRKEGEVLDRILGAMKTGLTMTMTTIAAVIVAFIFSESDVIKQIMTILLIGLIIDIINTWIQNAGLIRFYLEKKSKNG